MILNAAGERIYGLDCEGRTTFGNAATMEILGWNPRDPSNLAVIENGTGEQADFVTDAELREQEKANMLAALRHANWRIWGSDGAAELLGLKPSTLTYRMKVFGIRKDASPRQ